MYRKQYCTNCLRHDEYKEAEVGDGHHPHYDKDVTTPLCDRCHVEITSLNCAVARSFIPRKRLTTEQRLAVFKRWFVEGFSIFVRSPKMDKILDVDPDAVRSSFQWLGALGEAKKMGIKFPCKGVMTYEIEYKGKPIAVFHLHESADE